MNECIYIACIYIFNLAGHSLSIGLILDTAAFKKFHQIMFSDILVLIFPTASTSEFQSIFHIHASF